MRELLEKYHQQRLIKYLENLKEEERLFLEKQLDGVDFSVLDEIAIASDSEEIAPIPYLSHEEILKKSEEYARTGREALKNGKVAAVLLAGGQGTRLGSSLPKGMFNIGVTRNLYIFELHTKRLLSLSEEVGAYIPFLIMTSEKNHDMTKEFFKAHDFFGYPPEFIKFFPQNMAPCVDFEGNLLLEDRAKLALSPDGNGGWYGSLIRSNLLKEFPAVEWFNIFGVDNVLVKPADPVFVGATIQNGMDCGVKGVKKGYPEEKVGLLVLKGGRPSVIEYYEMEKENASRLDENGELLYRFGVTLDYLFSAKRMREIAGEKLPVHVVKKKVSYFDGERIVTPDRENAYKFETLILDMVREMKSCLPFETLREEEFAPVKNATGVDSVDTARELLRKNHIEI